MKIGATDIIDCKIGTTQVESVYLGTNLVWQHTIPSYLLDTYGGAEIAFSVRLLSSLYSGDCLRVREGASTLDIGFVGDILDSATMLSFVGSNDGDVSRLFFQDGSGFFATQSVNASQPRIVQSGLPVLVNSMPAMNFINRFMDLPASVTLNSSYSMFFVCRRSALANYFVTLAGSQTAPVSSFGFFSDPGLTDKPLLIKSNAYALANSAISTTNQMVFSALVTPTTIEIYIDGTLVSSTYNTGSYWNTFDYIGKYAGVVGYGYFQEGILYNSGAQHANHAAIVANQKAGFSIP